MTNEEERSERMPGDGKTIRIETLEEFDRELGGGRPMKTDEFHRRFTDAIIEQIRRGTSAISGPTRISSGKHSRSAG